MQRGHATLFALKLAFLLFLQLAFLLYVAIVCGVFKNKEHNTEFIGHLGPGMFLVGENRFAQISLMCGGDLLFCFG